jgi:hypothetical protein
MKYTKLSIGILITILILGVTIINVFGFLGFGNTLTWQEEVKLLDGRVITVKQKRRIDGSNIEREAWLTFKLPEFGNKEIVWHESLDVLVLNVYQGKIYIVGIPGTEREFRQYGSPMPPYIGYRYGSGQWIRLPFNEIPPAIYQTNMYFENMAITKLKRVSLADKEELMKNERYPNELKKIDPSSQKH